MTGTRHNPLIHHWRRLWPLVKSLQTGLLLATGLAGYSSAACPVTHPGIFLALAGSLFLAISGSTVLNMWFDRDIDARMARTCHRPLPSGQVTPQEALRLGLALAILGVGWAAWLAPLYGLLVAAGLFCDVVVYTMWLKRRCPWSIVWGGMAGGMPILAGRALANGGIDWIGLSLALGVLLWIPTHILTFAMRHSADYRAAGVPTVASMYGFQTARRLIAASSLGAGLAIGAAALGLGVGYGYLHLLWLLSGGLLALALAVLARPSEQANFRLFKFASIYMLSAMLVLVLQAL
jgi:protoheme IX farnesyltransferase